MRTPYPELWTDTTATRAAFAEWNAQVRLARFAYWQDQRVAAGLCANCPNARPRGDQHRSCSTCRYRNSLGRKTR